MRRNHLFFKQFALITKCSIKKKGLTVQKITLKVPIQEHFHKLFQVKKKTKTNCTPRVGENPLFSEVEEPKQMHLSDFLNTLTEILLFIALKDPFRMLGLHLFQKCTTLRFFFFYFFHRSLSKTFSLSLSPLTQLKSLQVKAGFGNLLF